jgi:hypothetical protein
MVGQVQGNSKLLFGIVIINHHHSNYPPTVVVGPVSSTLIAKVFGASNEMECVDNALAVIEFWTRHATIQQGFDSHMVLATSCLETFGEPVMFHFTRHGHWS